MRSIIIAAGVLLATAAQAQDPYVFYLFDQTRDYILRLEDRNHDGDALDADEVTIYMNDAIALTGVENAQGMYALAVDDLLATDNFAPDNVVRLRDLNGDGDAFDANEALVWNSGALPGGGNLTNPVCLSAGPGGALYLIDNNTLDTVNPEAVYALRDDNLDGDADDPGEMSLYFTLSPAGASLTTTFDIEFDESGAGYVYDITDPNDIESIDRINPGATAIAEWLGSDTLFSLAGLVFSAVQELTYDPVADAIVTSATNLGGSTFLISAQDRNGNNLIDAANEVRIIWQESGSGVSVGTPRDLIVLNDGSIIFLEALNDQVIRLVDGNSDGDFFDAGEARVIYSSPLALAAGLPDAPLMLSIAAAPLPSLLPGDLNCDGVVSVADIGAFVLALTDPAGYAVQFPACDPLAGDLNDDGLVTVGDIGAFVALLTGG